MTLREMFGNPELHARIAQIGSLPSPPETYDGRIAILRNDDCSIRDIAAAVAKDIALTAKIPQMINSVYFGLPSRINSVLQAVHLLGLETMKSLVMAVGVFGDLMHPTVTCHGLTIDSLLKHSVTVGTNSQRIAVRIGLPRYM